MIHSLDIEDFLEQSEEQLVLDVRSEGEYNYGHIPRAANLPLFDNEERKTVGTIYKQQGRNEAILMGLDIVGKKMSGFVRNVQPQVRDNKIFVHCWRGGMRSASMAWLFNQFEYDVFVLKDGYKAYRRQVLETIGDKYKLLILGGKTGSGKTDVLRELKNLGEQVIDLEALASHKGSAFGALGQPPQPSTEHFENLLAEELKTFDTGKRIWMEDESKTIGKVFIDHNLWNNMCRAPIFVLEVPENIRVKRLVADYGENQHNGLEQAITNIKVRLGNEQWKNAIDALHNKDFAQVAAITLYYYDKAYDKSLLLKDKQQVYRFAFDEGDVKMMAADLKCAADLKNI